MLAAGGIDLGDRRAIHLLRRERRLVALLRRAFGVRSLAVHLRHAAPAAEELLVDEVGDAGFLRAGSERVGGNQPRHRCVEERDLRRAEKHVLLALGRAMGRMLRPRGDGNGGGAQRAGRFQETATTRIFLIFLLHISSPEKTI